MIVIIDYGAGNLGSIKNMLKKLGSDSEISSDSQTVMKASKIILPGVGSFDFGMTKLEELGLVEVLQEKVLKQKIPFLGVCLGFQLLCKNSEEGTKKGLGWFDATVKRFPKEVNGQKLRVPHMGWNNIAQKKKSDLLNGLSDDPRFYFVHSYYVEAAEQQEILTTTHYGLEFHSALIRDNVIGLQFHPEKSHKFGKLLYTNFLKM